jgi:hypothetical protein
MAVFGRLVGASCVLLIHRPSALLPPLLSPSHRLLRRERRGMSLEMGVYGDDMAGRRVMTFVGASQGVWSCCGDAEMHGVGRPRCSKRLSACEMGRASPTTPYTSLFRTFWFHSTRRCFLSTVAPCRQQACSSTSERKPRSQNAFCSSSVLSPQSIPAL